MRDIISFPPAKRNRANCAIAARTAIVIRPSRHVSTATQPCPTISHPSNNHNSTILRVEYKNNTISTKPSYISDSPTPTDTHKQFNLNQKTGARSSVQSPLQAKCRASSTQRSRSRVTFVTLPATPRPVPSKKRQRFTTIKYQTPPSSTWRCRFRRIRLLTRGRGAQVRDRRGRA